MSDEFRSESYSSKVRDDVDLLSNFERDFEPLQKRGILAMLDALLKHPGRLIYELINGRFSMAAIGLFGILITSTLFYGFIMGSFAGDMQLFIVPLKVTIGLLLSGLICLPSLYIFASLSGGEQSLLQVAGIMLLSLALSSLLLVGFAPVTWIFSQSTGTAGFMGAMHIMFWLAAVYFGTSLLFKAFQHLNKRSMCFLKLWVMIFIIVVLQMSTALRPLVGKYDGAVFASDKKFFLEHWGDSMNTRARR